VFSLVVCYIGSSNLYKLLYQTVWYHISEKCNLADVTYVQTFLISPTWGRFKISLPLTGILGSKYKNDSGIKLFNHLLSHIRSLSGYIKLLTKTPKQLLHSNSFYSIGEYFDFQVEWWVYSKSVLNINNRELILTLLFYLLCFMAVF
jgi:hypothetical protein